MDAETRKEFKDLHEKIDHLTDVVSDVRIAHQDSKTRIDLAEIKIHSLCKKHNEMVKPDGVITKIRDFQNSCPRKTYKAWFYALLILMLALFSVSMAIPPKGMSQELSLQYGGVLGPETDNYYKVDYSFIGFNILDNLDNEIYITGIQQEGFTPGIGTRLKYCFPIDPVKLYLTGGALLLYNGGSIDGLAGSWLYGSLGAQVKYKNFFIGIEHNSSPFHHGEDGDKGINAVSAGFQFNF